jgi:prophage maintenance system killer protein
LGEPALPAAAHPLFLELNGCRFVADEAAAAQAVLELAAGRLDEPGLIAFLRANVEIG